jgi:hypothetical protein
VEWEEFSRAAYALAKKEDRSYPQSGSQCLLCERPFDEQSRKHVEALLTFVEGDAKRAALLAEQFRTAEIARIDQVNCKIFSAESRTRSHIHRIDPVIETIIDDSITLLEQTREATLNALAERAPIAQSIDVSPVTATLKSLVTRINADIQLLEKENTAEAISKLELEHQTLRHRKLISQLLPSIERFVSDRIWRLSGEQARSALNPRAITEKEKELFGKLIGKTYKEKFAHECNQLECRLPIEPQTAGQKGKTMKSLSIKGGYPPESILSEGEQRAVAVADFLTEVGLNPANAGIVLDDPVTSQDHQRKELIAQRLVREARNRQVIIFTHDLVFLNNIIVEAEKENLNYEAHWIACDNDGNPGHITLNDAPITSKAYDTTEHAKKCLAKAKSVSGSERHDAISKGMGALRRTVEETIAKRLLKGVIPRWSDRVIVTGLRKIVWDQTVVDDLCLIYEELSKYIEGHSHTDEAMGAPPELKDLDEMVKRVDDLIKKAKPDRKMDTGLAAA